MTDEVRTEYAALTKRRREMQVRLARHYHDLDGCEAEEFAGPGCGCVDRARWEQHELRQTIETVFQRYLGPKGDTTE